jgi:cation diffusion facilitator CzcD-associated flavoprotein CzcO
LNRYPGCQCDIPAHNYAYSFEPNPSWPNYYATSEQIYDYMHMVADKYHCKEYFQYNHEITAATWDEKSGKWNLKVRNAQGDFDDQCDVFINAGGLLK